MCFAVDLFSVSRIHWPNLLWTPITCSCMAYLRVKLLPHCRHLNFFGLPWTPSMCLVRLLFNVKLLSHFPHEKGFFRSWTPSMCIISWLLHVKLWSHRPHACIFIFVPRVAPSTGKVCEIPSVSSFSWTECIVDGLTLSIDAVLAALSSPKYRSNSEKYSFSILSISLFAGRIYRIHITAWNDQWITNSFSTNTPKCVGNAYLVLRLTKIAYHCRRLHSFPNPCQP